MKLRDAAVGERFYFSSDARRRVWERVSANEICCDGRIPKVITSGLKARAVRPVGSTMPRACVGGR